MSASFISEHTAELVLVPELLTSLKLIYSKITPLYYWVSREGAAMSRHSFAGKEIKLLVLYARRPKIEFPGCGYIEIKLNQILFDRCSFFEKHGIPVIAGVPLADKLEDIQLGVDCIWLRIQPNGSETILKVNLDGKHTFSSDFNALSIVDLEAMIENSKTMTWNEGLEKINEMRRSTMPDGRYYHQYMSGDLYKPVYLLIHKN